MRAQEKKVVLVFGSQAVGRFSEFRHNFKDHVEVAITVAFFSDFACFLPIFEVGLVVGKVVTQGFILQEAIDWSWMSCVLYVLVVDPVTRELVSLLLKTFSSLCFSEKGRSFSAFHWVVMEPTVEVNDGVVIVLTFMASGWNGGCTGEQKLQYWVESVLTARSVTSLGGAQSAGKPTRNAWRRLTKAGLIITLVVESTTRSTWYGVDYTIYTVPPQIEFINGPLAVRIRHQHWDLQQKNAWKVP